MFILTNLDAELILANPFTHHQKVSERYQSGNMGKKNMSHPHPHPQCREVTVKEATGAISWKLTWWNLTEWGEEGWCDVLQPS